MKITESIYRRVANVFVSFNLYIWAAAQITYAKLTARFSDKTKTFFSPLLKKSELYDC